MNTNVDAIDLGTVAMVKNQHGVWNRAILTFHPFGGEPGKPYDYGWRPGIADVFYGTDCEARPLLVIDPEDPEQTSALFRAADTTLGGFRENLRVMATPVPREPAGDRPLVVDKDGDVWQKRSGDWANTYGGVANWRGLNEQHGPLTVLREGDTPKAES